MSVRQRRSSRSPRAILTALLLVLPLGAGPSAATAAEPFPEHRPATRQEAIELFAGLPGSSSVCLTTQLQALPGPPQRWSLGVRRAVALLQRPVRPQLDQLFLGADGARIRYTTGDGAVDRMLPIDADHDGRPDLLQATASGLRDARRLFVERLQLAGPELLEVLHLDLGGTPSGYTIPGTAWNGRAHTTVVLEARPAGGPDSARRAAIHQYAHAVALATHPELPVEWGEALATWATLTLDGMPDAETAARLAHRLERLDAGLASTDLTLAAGGAAWLAFVEQAHGPAALRLTIDELARPEATVADALDRALRSASDDDLAAAFREFHLWSILIGQRADRFHFPFADQLPTPGFVSTAEGLPALSVQADPAVAPWGATQVRIRPDRVADPERNGGMHVHFEGEFTARWEADLILVGDDGTRRRLALDFSPEGRAEATVPLGGLAEALLLVRNVTDDGSPRRYSYAVHRERGYPFEMASFEALAADDPTQGVIVSWETASEQELVGFNILRVREEGGSEVVVNPVWIPGLGDASNATAYQYLDRGADPDTSYVYRIQGITRLGLTALSDPVTLRRPRQ